MKKVKYWLLFFVFIFVFPAFIFACDEQKFEDIPYTGSSTSIADLISKVGSTRSLMIDSLKLKLNLKTVNTYTFYETTNQEYTAKVVRDEITTTLGKVSEVPAIAMVNISRFVDNVLFSTQEYHYVTNSNNLNSFCYLKTQTYNEDGDAVSEEMYRSIYNSSLINFGSLFTDVVKVVYPNEFDIILEKSFEGITYYKLISDVTGINVVNDTFKQDANLFENPQLFVKTDATRDFVLPFECEFGLKVNEGYNYITFSSIKYDVMNDYNGGERYLHVESQTNLTEYGDHIQTTQPENIDEYTARTFVREMQQDENYIVYKTAGVDNSYNQITAVKLQDNYSVMVEKFTPGQSTITEYYFFEKQEENSESVYLIYKLNLDTSTAELSSLDLDILKFTFNLQIDSKNGNYYQFGNSETYIKVEVTDGEVSNVSTMFESNELALEVVDFGVEYAKFGLAEDLLLFTKK